ncbi:MAG: hypothetical protein MH204_00195, partial [Fimbriimonadaceae bacterium]|nr:hypothetical protein [Fimbriimonadaceae bacterium]
MSPAISAVLALSCLATASCAPSPGVEQATASATASISAAEINAQMASGFNLGNTFDLQLNPTNRESIKPILDLYRSAGIKH